MEKLKEELEALKQELEEMQAQWANEIKKMAEKPGYDVYSEKTDKQMEKIANRYVKPMMDNMNAQKAIAEEIGRLKEEERKKLYKD